MTPKVAALVKNLRAHIEIAVYTALLDALEAGERENAGADAECIRLADERDAALALARRLAEALTWSLRYLDSFVRVGENGAFSHDGTELAGYGAKYRRARALLADPAVVALGEGVGAPYELSGGEA